MAEDGSGIRPAGDDELRLARGGKSRAGPGERCREMGQEPRRWWRQVDRSQVQVLGRLTEHLHRGSAEPSVSGVPVVRQKRGNDCGPAALAAIAAYYGCAFDYDDLSRETALDRHGTDLLVLSRIRGRAGSSRSRHQGFVRRDLTVHAARDRPSPLRMGRRALRCPSSMDLGARRRRRSGQGSRTLSRKSFCRRATGYLLLVQPDQRTTTAERCALRTNALVEGGRAESIGAVAERCRT